jgi:hypothetical protein
VLVARSEVTVTACQLKNTPPAFHRVLVGVFGFLSHGFEDFTLFDPTLPIMALGIWLEYGGHSQSGTMYCCGVTADGRRLGKLVIEGIPILLVMNDPFERFDKAIQPPFRCSVGQPSPLAIHLSRE